MSAPMAPQSGRFLVLVVLGIALLSYCSCREIQLQAIQIKPTYNIPLGTKAQFDEPDFNFQKIYKREVYAINNGVMEQFFPCHENRAEVEFSADQTYHFSDIPQKPLVIYNFDQITRSQFMLDVFYDQDSTIYMMMENGRVGVATIQKKGTKMTISGTKFMTITGLPKGPRLMTGYFTQIKGYTVFVNPDYIIMVTKQQAEVISDERHPRFQSAISIEGKYLAIADRSLGVQIYSFDPKKIEFRKILTITPSDILDTNATSVMISDLAYYDSQKALFVLTQNEGVSSFKLTFNVNDDIKFGNKYDVTTRDHCDIMFVYGHNLYVSCDDVYRYFLGEWPTIEEQLLEHPLIKIRQVFENEDVLALVGRNSFKLMYLDRLVNYYQDQQIDKVIFYKDFFINANQNGISIGHFKIIKPYVTCRTFAPKHVGTHSLAIKTYAECNQNYFYKNNVNTTNVGAFSEDDVCIYTVYRRVHFWQKGRVYTTPIIVVGVIIGVTAIVVMVVMLLKRRKLKIVQMELQEFSSIKESSGESGKYHNFAQEMDDKSKSATDNQLNPDGAPAKDENFDIQ